MMSPCPHANETAEALKSGRWPQGCDDELRRHAEACHRCGDLVLVTQAFQQSRGEAFPVARLESPSLLWWRAQLRRRNAAVEQVGRPITFAQTFALLVLLAAAASVALQWRHGVQWALMWSSFWTSHAFHMNALWSSSVKLDWTYILLIPCLGALALLSGVVLYLVSEER
jgi:hypothetical protein